MTGFDLHGIDHLSASSLNAWTTQPALWVMERLLKRGAPVGCAAHRGSAVEHGVTVGLLKPDAPVADCQAAALQDYDRRTALSGDPNRDKERDCVADIVAVALKELRQYGVPSGVQTKVEIGLDDVPVPLVGYLDFLFEQHGIIVDLKTSLKLSSAISAAHARQGAIYQKARGNFDMRFAYTTPKKIGVYSLEDGPEHLNALRNIALRLERFLRISKDPSELAGFLCPDFEHYFWNNPTARATGREVFGF